MSEWQDWRPFPDPMREEYLYAPFGHGVYELRNKKTGQYVLFGKGSNVAYRMSSLLPEPLGCGARNNSKKRSYVLEHITNIEYRTLSCCDQAAADMAENQLKCSGKDYIFKT